MSMTLKGASVPSRALSGKVIDLPALVDFHSPTEALMVEPTLHSARGVTWLVATLVAACFTAAAIVPIDKVVTAQGRIVALQATTVLQPLETAIVRSIDVHEGDAVHKGQVLARLDPTFATADAGALKSQVASLQAEVDRLSAEANGTDYRPDNESPTSLLQGAVFIQRKAERAFKNENYTQKLNSLMAQFNRARSDVAGYSERLQVASEVERRRRELEQDKVGSVLNRLAATDARLEVQRGLDGAMQQQAQAARDMQAMKAERDGYNENWMAQVSKDLTDQTRKLSDAQENLAKALLRQNMVELRAEADSVVLSVARVSPGSVMQSGEQLITLVPKDAPLEAEVNVPGAEAGYIHPGDPVNLKLDTLPYTQYGTVSGTVRVMSPDSFSTAQEEQPPKRGSQPSRSPSLGPSFYRARITLDTAKLHNTPQGFHMMPGMPLTADVKVGKRTLVAYLFSRVLPAFMNGMREP